MLDAVGKSARRSATSATRRRFSRSILASGFPLQPFEASAALAFNRQSFTRNDATAPPPPVGAPFPNVYEIARKRFARPKIDAVLSEFRPDVVVLFSAEDAETLFYRRPPNDFATILTTHNPPDVVFQRVSSAKALKATLARCDVVQTLPSSFVPAIRALTSTKIVVVPNVVPQFQERVDVERREREGSPRIVCVGRFDKRQKRQALRVEAFAKIAARRPDWNVSFFGDPSPNARYRDKLVPLVSQLKLENRVFIHPSTILRQNSTR